MHEEDQYVVRAIEAGAMGYVTKQSAPEQLVEAVKRIHAGGRYLSFKTNSLCAAGTGSFLDQQARRLNLDGAEALAALALAPLGAAGRMALTVYLSGSIMFGTLFYGFALGKAFYLGPAAVTGYAVLFFAIQILIAVLWTSRFRFGPMEWLWRRGTYGAR